MSLKRSGLNPLAYMGVEPSQPAQFIPFFRDPTPNDINFNIGTVWLNRKTETPWMLVNLDKGIATWIMFGSSTGDIVELMGNSGTASGPIVTVTTGAGNAQGTALFTGDGVHTLTETFSDANNNTGLGTSSLADLSGGINNTALGVLSGTSVTSGSGNVFVGVNSGLGLTTGTLNTLIGDQSYLHLTSGDSNIGLGVNAGSNYTTTESSNILLNNIGILGESNTLRVGLSTGTGNKQLSNTYISGIQGVNVGSVASVVSISGDHLGTTTLTPGTGITITPVANTIVIAATGDIVELMGNSGTASGPIVTVTTGAGNAEGTALFTGDNVHTLTETFTDENNNTGLGKLSFSSLTSGILNTGLGLQAGIRVTSGIGNTLIGAESGNSLTTGSSNVFLGSTSGVSALTGNFNTGLGTSSGISYTSSESSNITINSPGVISESNTLRIGSSTGTGVQQLSNAYISGIQGVNVGSVASVVSISGDHLGTTTLTAGSGITVTPGANTISISATGAGSTGLTLIQTQSAASVATLPFTTGISTTYNNYLMLIDSVNCPTASSDSLYIQISTNGGSTWISTNYIAGSSTPIGLSTGVGNLSTNTVNLGAAVQLTNVTSGTGFLITTGTNCTYDPGTSSTNGVNNPNGVYTVAGTVVNAFRVIVDGTKVFSGTFSLYGYSK
jgi:trimeric autotransporter adhesin